MLRLTILSSFLAIFILSCQVLGLQKIQEACNSPLGIQNGQVPDNHFSASSYFPYLYIGRGENKDMKAKYCRLNHQYAWCTNRRREQPWFMVDLGRIMNVIAISTQGYAGVGDYFVTSFKLAYSRDKRTWEFVGKNRTVKEFVGNKHGLDIKNNTFDQIQARFIKVVPTKYHVRICLRIELYGCAAKEPPSHQSTTTVPSSPLAPTTSSPTVAVTTTPPFEGATLKNGLQRKSSDVDEEKKIKNYFIIAGLMGGLVLVGCAGFFILFIVLRRRKKKQSGRCQLVNLPAYPRDNGVDSNESMRDSLISAQESESTAPLEM